MVKFQLQKSTDCLRTIFYYIPDLKYLIFAQRLSQKFYRRIIPRLLEINAVSTWSRPYKKRDKFFLIKEECLWTVDCNRFLENPFDLNWKQNLGINERLTKSNPDWVVTELEKWFVDKYEIREDNRQFHSIFVPFQRLICFSSNSFMDVVFQINLTTNSIDVLPSYRHRRL